MKDVIVLRTNIRHRIPESTMAALALVFKFAQSASRRWRALNDSDLIPDVIEGMVFVDGFRTEQSAA